MRRREFTTATLTLALGGCQGAGSALTTREPEPPPPEEQAAAIAALRPPKRDRPLIVLVADPGGAETTDLIVPYGVMKRSGLCEIVVASSHKGPTRLRPALTIETEMTFDEILANEPDGPDYVIVPALHNRASAAAVEFIRTCAESEATVAGICAGALTLEAAGLLSDRRATTHWWDVGGLADRNPGMTWVRDRRYVVDRGVATTTGVSASLPFSLAVVEAIGGREPALALAAELGVGNWDARHNSDAFRRRGDVIAGAALNALAFWEREIIGVEVEDGVDEIALAFTADAWSRAYRSRAHAIGRDSPIRTRGGLLLHVSDTDEVEVEETVSLARHDRPGRTLEGVLDAISQRHGARTAHLVALQLEYPWTGR